MSTTGRALHQKADLLGRDDIRDEQYVRLAEVHQIINEVEYLMGNDHYPDTTTFPRIRDVPAAVTERQRISKAVRGLPVVHNSHGRLLLDLDPWLVDLDAVLEIIDGQP